MSYVPKKYFYLHNKNSATIRANIPGLGKLCIEKDGIVNLDEFTNAPQHKEVINRCLGALERGNKIVFLRTIKLKQKTKQKTLRRVSFDEELEKLENQQSGKYPFKKKPKKRSKRRSNAL